MRKTIRSIFLVLLLVAVVTSGCIQTPAGSGVTSTSTSAPISTATQTPTLFPVNIGAIHDSILLTVENASLIQQVAYLWSEKLAVSSMAFYPDKNLIALGVGSSYFSSPFGFGGLSGKTRLVLWDPETNTGQDAMETGNPDITFNSVAISPDGRWAAFVGTDRIILGALRVDSIEGGITFEGQEIPLTDLANPNPDLGAVFSTDSNLLAIVNQVGDVLVWDVAANRQLAVFMMGTRLVQGFETPECAINAHSVTFTSDNQSVLSSCNGTVISWDIRSFERSNLPQSFGNTVVFALSPDGQTLVTGDFDGTIQAWNFPSGELQMEWTLYSQQISSLAFSVDGSILASSSQDDTVDLWDTHTWTRLATLDARADFLAFSPDGKFLVLGTHGDGGTLWGVNIKSSAIERIGVKVVLSEGAAPLDAWQDSVPEAWLSPAETFPRHEIRVVSSWVSVDLCHYDIGGTQRFVYRRQSIITVQITDMETGTILDEETFKGGIPAECPETRLFSENVFNDYIDGTEPDLELFVPWLTDVMSAAGYPQ